MSGVESWLPRFDVRERHERVVAAEPERALAIALETPVCPDRIVRTLFRLRGLGGASTASIAEFASTRSFVALERTRTTYVFGAAVRLRGRPRAAADPESWLAWGAQGIKIAADFRAEPAGGGRSLLSTETRVLALDRRSRLLFRLYWLGIGPFSALIRRRWLRAIAARAEAE